MKITGVRTKLIEIPLSRALGDSNNPVGRNRMAHTVIYIDTDEGVTGTCIGTAGCGGQVHQMVNDLLVGHDPRGVRGLWKKMVDFVFKGGNKGIVNDAIWAIDVALWDLKAKLNDEPLWKTLGANTRRVKAYGSGIDICLSDEEIFTFYSDMAAQGVSAGKLKIGLDMESDLRRIGIMRDALAESGKTPALIIDINEYWSPKQAVRNVCRIEQDYDITWVEEPVRRWDYRGLRKVSQGIKAAVSTGENLDDVSEFTPLLANEAADVYNVGQYNSGVTGALIISSLCYAYNMPVSMMNVEGNTMAHLAAAMPNHWMMEVVGAGREQIYKSVDNHIEDGWIVLGDKPGLGVELDEAKVAEWSIETPSRGASSSPWGQRRGAGLFAVGPDEPEWPEE